MREEIRFPVLRALVEKGVVRTLIAMPPEKRREVFRELRTQTAAWAIGMGCGRFIMGLIRLMVEGKV